MAKKRAKAKPAKKAARKKVGKTPAAKRKTTRPRAKKSQKPAVVKVVESLGGGAMDLLRAWSPSRYSPR